MSDIDIQAGDFVKIGFTGSGIVEKVTNDDIVLAYVEDFAMVVKVPICSVTKIASREPGDGSIMITCEGCVYQNMVGANGTGWYSAGSLVNHKWSTLAKQGGYKVIREGWGEETITD